MAQLASPGGKPLSYSADDVLWLSRAVEAEGEPRDLVAQTLVNRWAWLADQMPGKFRTLAALVRAYATPVNPLYYPGQALSIEEIAKAEARGQKKGLTPAELAAQRAALERKAETRRDVLSTRKQFSPATNAAVRQALMGPITLPAGAVHYAASWVERPDLPLLVEGGPGRNSIWGAEGNRAIGALYHFWEAGPTATYAAAFGEKPHAVIGFLFLTGGSLVALAARRRKR